MTNLFNNFALSFEFFRKPLTTAFYDLVRKVSKFIPILPSLISASIHIKSSFTLTQNVSDKNIQLLLTLTFPIHGVINYFYAVFCRIHITCNIYSPYNNGVTLAYWKLQNSFIAFDNNSGYYKMAGLVSPCMYAIFVSLYTYVSFINNLYRKQQTITEREDKNPFIIMRKTLPHTP